MLCSQPFLPRPHPTSAKKILTGLNIVASVFQDHIITVSHGLLPQLATSKLGLESFLGQGISGWEQQLWGSLQGGWWQPQFSVTEEPVLLDLMSLVLTSSLSEVQLAFC